MLKQFRIKRNNLPAPRPAPQPASFDLNALDDVAFITLTNSGYIDYTLNCLKSLELIGAKKQLCCYCIGAKGFQQLKKLNYTCRLIDDEQHSNFQQFRTGNWSNITIKKFDIIYENLLTHKFVLFTDGDIVYENKDFLQYLLLHIGTNDILIQNDSLQELSNSNLCSGFMFIKSNSTTLNCFNPAKVSQHENQLGWDDQVYVNNIKTQLKHQVLPLNLFPNGAYFYKNYQALTPFLIHFNWVVGHEKQRKMKEFRKWYQDQDQD